MNNKLVPNAIKTNNRYRGPQESMKESMIDGQFELNTALIKERISKIEILLEDFLKLKATQDKSEFLNTVEIIDDLIKQEKERYF